jgi:thiol-disulfide isomerase/thioredoxin
MALTPSNMLPLGSLATPFKLADAVTHKPIELKELQSEVATVICFICNHCPFVKHIQAGLVELANAYIPQKISFVAINSNDPALYPEDSFPKMKETALALHFPFPYLFDETQEVAKAYQAACTPDFYIFDKNLCCIYRGQFDESRPNNQIPVTGHDIRQALENILAGQPVNAIQKPSIGCNIKWKD